MSAIRHNQIVEMVNLRGECDVVGLAKRFDVSEMTIRRDLQALAEKGQILRTHGGAAPAERISFEFNFLKKAGENQIEKLEIASIAASMVSDHQTVFMESGSTTLAVARALKGKKGIRVITTSLPIASELQFCDQLEVMLLGGIVRRGSPDLVGALTESNLEQLRADFAFISAEAIDLKGNVYNVSLDVTRMLNKMSQHATQTFVVSDHTKVGKVASIKFGNISQLSGLITDSDLDRKSVAALSQASVRVIQKIAKI